MQHKNEFLTLSPHDLLRQCQQHGYQGSGPGGQKRNHGNSGIRLVFTALNLEIRCAEDRSAQVNLKKALKRLQLTIAIEHRDEVIFTEKAFFPGSNGRINPNNDGFPQFIGQMLDRLYWSQGRLKPVAEFFNISSSALNKIIFSEKALIEKVQQIRKEFEQTPLKAPGKR